jgi:hypothetical protein
VSDAQETLGSLIDERAGRDAIHVAVFPAVAGDRLAPGQHVGKDGAPSTKPHVGIVDPFLAGPVFPGERFWVLLYPRTITGLRHVWTHPAFGESAEEPVQPGISRHEAWIRQFADRVGLGYSTLMEGAAEWVRTHDGKWGGEYLCLGGLLEGESVPDEFWPHYEAVTGTSVPEKARQSFFSCSC